MRISEKLGLSMSPYEMDFLDVDIEKDSELYIDPFLIANSNSQWAIQTDLVIKSFFNEFKLSMEQNDYERAKDLFAYMSEPKENCLGMSKKGTTNGRGVGELNAQEIVDRIIKSNAIENNLVNNIEDLIIFVDDIDRDKLSDMVTNIIRKKLIEYTQQQCDFWNIPLTLSETLPYWSAQDCTWMYSENERLLIIDNREILLVPKSIISPINVYEGGKYKRHFVEEQEREFHLQRRSSLTRMRRLKNGSTRYYVLKRDVENDIKSKINNHEFENNKDYLRKYTQQYPNLFSEFVKSSKGKIESLSNEEIVKKLAELSIDDIIDKMIFKLKHIPTGRKNATEFHYYVKALLEILWYPYLVNPIVEREIHDGRKRIDITMDNNDKGGFFYKLHDISKIFCPYVYIECKNYGNDVANPEIDQLAGRFSSGRGQFGLLICRDLNNKDLFVKRCQDTYRDGRGLILYLVDDDIIQMLNAIHDEEPQRMWRLLEDKKREVIIS
ncbi:hypothetical protein DXC92_01635 [Clostridiales bacterium TF09-2AC]|nr:hypothetical protein DXC92_01635 [Clostridiales bacterium TF09-2AC]